MKKIIAATAALAVIFGAFGLSSKSKKKETKMKDETTAWVLSYFLGQGNSAQENALYLAYSKDGLHWEPLNEGKPAYVLEGIGGNRIRDPFLFRKNDGKFILIATDWTLWQTPQAISEGYWSNPSPYLIIADSDDLITFKNPRRIDFAQFTPEALENRKSHGWPQMHCWAPEVFYDEQRKEYGVIWSGDGDLEGNSVVNRTYVNYTKDFINFSKPELFFELTDENGNNITEIDATLIQHEKNWYMFFKGEANDAKDIQEAKSSTLKPGSFELINNRKYITRGAAQDVKTDTEGPFIIKVPGENKWYLYADFYCRDGVFGCWETTDLEADPADWKLLNLEKGEYSLPFGVRHANTVRVTEKELNALLKK